MGLLCCARRGGLPPLGRRAWQAILEFSGDGLTQHLDRVAGNVLAAPRRQLEASYGLLADATRFVRSFGLSSSSSSSSSSSISDEQWQQQH